MFFQYLDLFPVSNNVNIKYVLYMCTAETGEVWSKHGVLSFDV